MNKEFLYWEVWTELLSVDGEVVDVFPTHMTNLSRDGAIGVAADWNADIPFTNIRHFVVKVYKTYERVEDD